MTGKMLYFLTPYTKVSIPTPLLPSPSLSLPVPSCPCAMLKVSASSLLVGACVTLTQLIEALQANADKSSSFPALAEHLLAIANVPVRNVSLTCQHLHRGSYCSLGKLSAVQMYVHIRTCTYVATFAIYSVSSATLHR